MITYPFAVLVGRRWMRSPGGVPAVPYQRWIEEWPNVWPNQATFRAFRRATFVTVCVGGFLFAHYMTDYSHMKNPWHTRPDFKPFPAMVVDNTTYDK